MTWRVSAVTATGFTVAMGVYYACFMVTTGTWHCNGPGMSVHYVNTLEDAIVVCEQHFQQRLAHGR